jgi:hypothetical protein
VHVAAQGTAMAAVGLMTEERAETRTSRQLVGRFLGFMPDRHLPKNLSERKSRSFWEQTETRRT